MNLYNLQYDYSNINGKSFIFFIDSEAENNELSEIQVKMLQTNNIPRVLSLEIEEMDFKVRLRFNLGGKKALKYYLDEITINQYFQLLLNIAMTIKDSKLYMLNEDNYIIRSDFIFIGSNLNDIYLTYLPVKNLTDKMDFRVELISLSTELITYVKNIEGNEFQELISYMKKGDFNIAELIERLLLIINKVNKPQDEQKLVVEKKSVVEHNTNKKINPNKKIKKITSSRTPLTERQKVVLYTSALLLIAIIWKLYLEYPGEGFFYISIGLTLLILDIALILTAIWRPVISKIERKEVVKVNKKPAIPNNTTMLNKNETAFLGKNDGLMAQALLEIKRDNEVERIYIDSDNFIIGRGTKVNYVESSKGVSRAHFEISKNENGYGIKDLFSKNGTYLNSQQIVSNKLYPLKSGDVIAIGNLYFTFLNS